MALWPWSLLHSLVLLVVLSLTWICSLGSINTMVLCTLFAPSMSLKGSEFGPLWSATGLLCLIGFVGAFHSHYFLNALVIMLLSSVTKCSLLFN